ncbi:uncharacterized protein LAESUDRAFT_709421 [Laetiporus sulphureus 93-53]|uniref:Uncharacterized protein n=1 Tax=Laetiporus sulphureus 93-53 TaxID=1314785 RepID=A0A165B158_9APHY|nr:uncharacterized protein LAESUDRAFT_709421 [Laetiporus sulphureus 93-53]KZT00031.1 hypothetical protein LAESUDRAFT_709421 [Laetiporus sulphureus 93-53]
MEDPALRPAGDLPPEYSEVPIDSAVSPATPRTALATAPDGNPLLQSDANVIAQTVELPPDPGASADIQLDLKDPEVRDIGWNRDLAHLPPTIVHGLSNEDLFTLIRRFNKQIYHVKAIPPPPLGQLDLEISENEEFSPDKLRAHLERFYMSIIIGIAAFGKHIARIRSWNEPRRTAGFTIAYYLAWFNNLLGALISMTLLVLIMHPPSRRYLFPPAPLAAVSAKSGNLQVPRAGTIGSGDSLSGAPEAHKGEAVEQEATNFVSGVASLAIGTATGQKVAPHAGQSEDVDAAKQEEGGIGAAMPEPTQIAAQTADATHVAQGARADGKHDATKTHVEAAMWETARPAMRALSDVVDTWERFGNALSPTPPFSHAPRLRLAAVVLSLMVAMTIVPSALFVKATTFGIGFAIFGQPIMTRSVHWITTRYPNWREALELRRTLLKGVPTNAQLTVTLLRIAEAHKTPLPPPPSTNKVTEGEEHSDPEAAVKERDYEFDASNYEVESAHADENAQQDSEADTDGNAGKPRSGNKLTKLLKGTGKATVSGALGIDHIKAKMGSEAAKRRLGAVPEDEDKVITSDGPTGSRVGVGDGPTTYAARMHGKRGYVVLVTSAASPFLSFVWEKDLKRNLASIAKTVAAAVKAGPGPEPEVPPGVFTIALKEVGGLRKVGGYGWKGKMVIGWALQREVVDGLEIEDEAGEKRVLTAIKGRDELFNRLIAVGGHSWECY